MAIDTAEKRRSISGVSLPLIPGVTPDALKDQEWRQSSGWGYTGIPAGPPVTPPIVPEGYPWQSYMAGRNQDREIRQFVDAGVASAFGGLRSTSSPNYTLGAGYTKFTDFTTTSDAYLLDLSLANNTLSYEQSGIYAVNLAFVFTHDTNASNRTFNIRLFNETAGLGGDPIPIGVGANTVVTNFGNQTLITCKATASFRPGDEISVELGGGSSITGTFDNFTLSTFRISPLI